MRTRLAAILYLPTVLLLLLLGMAYAGSVARADQQQVYLDRLRDTGYLTQLARQSLAADDPDVVAEDLQRYGEVYGVGAAVLDQGGTTWASNGLDPQTVQERTVALAGRRSEPSGSFLPWEVDAVVVAEPVFEGGDLVGAVVTSSDVGHLSRDIWVSWAVLLVSGAAIGLLAIVIADRTAVWVLRPVRAVERAMDDMGRGQLAARIPESAGPPELREVIGRFNQMAERVEHLMHRQQEFVSNASHELRNPLNALMLRVEDLAMSTPQEHAAEVVSVRAEAVRMAHILDALLMLADDTSPDVDAEAVDVAALVARRVEHWQLLASGRGIELHVEDPERSWAVVNRTILESALEAVVDNAVKFAPQDTPVEVGVRGGEHVVEVSVRDHGDGVPVEELERMTERFWRSPAHRRVRGSGLGLAIAAELLELGGGELRLELAQGGGLRAKVRVPRGGDAE